MILKVFTMFDSKVSSFMAPFYMQSNGAAIRALIDTMADSNNQFSKHPEDFTLFELGEFDDADGSFNLHLTPLSVATCISLIPSC